MVEDDELELVPLLHPDIDYTDIIKEGFDEVERTPVVFSEDSSEMTIRTLRALLTSAEEAKAGNVFREFFNFIEAAIEVLRKKDVALAVPLLVGKEFQEVALSLSVSCARLKEIIMADEALKGKK